MKQRDLFKKIAAVGLCTVMCASAFACSLTGNNTTTDETTTTEEQTTISEEPPATIVLYDIMRFTTTMPETTTTKAYTYVEEINLENNTYCYATERDYYSIYQFYSEDGAFMCFKIGDMSCSFRAPNPNISSLTTLVNNINEYATAITTAELIGSNDTDWVYYSKDLKNVKFYEMLIPKGSASPSTILRMSGQNESTAKAQSSVAIDEITQLSYNKTSFSECMNISDDKIETVLAAFYSDVAGLSTQKDVTAFEKKLADNGQVLQDWYLAKALAVGNKDTESE